MCVIIRELRLYVDYNVMLTWNPNNATFITRLRIFTCFVRCFTHCGRQQLMSARSKAEWCRLKLCSLFLNCGFWVLPVYITLSLRTKIPISVRQKKWYFYIHILRIYNDFYQTKIYIILRHKVIKLRFAFPIPQLLRFFFH